MLAVCRYCRLIAELFPLGDLQIISGLLSFVFGHFSIARVDQHIAVQTVNNHQISCLDFRQYILGADYRRDLQGPGHDGRV
ncbi:hypothetical protein D3C86_1924540 [compost metagenome]